MLIQIVIIALMERISCDIFATVCRSCHEHFYFERFLAESLSHCTMKCSQRHQCISVSYNKESSNCKLYDMPATCCENPEQTNLTTMQWKENRHNCSFKTKSGESVAIQNYCGESFAKSPLVFKIKGIELDPLASLSETVGILLHNNSQGTKFFRVKLQDAFFIHASLSVSGDGNLKTWIGNVFSMTSWYTYWITYSRQGDGNTTVSLGKGEAVGCNTILQRSDVVDFEIVEAEAYKHSFGSMNMSWVFYDYF